MLNVVLIHCYSDQNRGDAGIIESTVDIIKNIDGSANVDGISVFHENDERYRNDHYFTGEILTKIYPSIFFEPSVQNNGKGFTTARKVITFLKILLINTLLLIFPYAKFAKLILSEQQFKTFQCLLDADVVISKGGSFLYSLKGINGEFFLLRMTFAFLLPLRLKKKVGIFSQSVGPFENKISKHLLFFVLRRLNNIYLREAECLKFLPADIANKIDIIPDSAFYLIPDNTFKVELSKNKKIAITARPHKFSSDTDVQTSMYDKYLNTLADMALHLIKLGYEVHLIGQVTGPSMKEDDRVALALLNRRLSSVQEFVTFWDEKNKIMSPKELQYLYSKMDLVIGTRLHSSIFSMAANVPTINIAYHGTKSQGIMKSVGLGEFVMEITNMNSSHGIKLIDKIISSNDFKTNLKTSVMKHRESLYHAMRKLI